MVDGHTMSLKGFKHKALLLQIIQGGRKGLDLNHMHQKRHKNACLHSKSGRKIEPE